MKISAIRISGFRGIPPIDPPNVNIPFAKKNDAQNILIFGPNAYGKSSISSALEWFFRESVHCSNYFEDYVESDNIHINIGKPNFPAIAFIEIDVIENGIVSTLRKEIGADGNKCNESIGKFGNQLLMCRDEIITLDHDEFRNFVSAASKEKWKTFASLIGYEELDNFRAGIDSLTQSSLNNYLQVTQLEKDRKSREADLGTKKSSLCAKFGLSTKFTITDVEKAFLEKLGLTLYSLNLKTPCFVEIDEEFWKKNRLLIIPSGGYKQNAERLAQLKKVLGEVTTFPKELFNILEEFSSIAEILGKRKAKFDKGVLSEFYKLGLDILLSDKVEKNLCPLCKSTYDTELLEQNIRGYINDLDFGDIQVLADKISALWQEVKKLLSYRLENLSANNFQNISVLATKLIDYKILESALKLSSFDEKIVISWVEGVKELQKELSKATSEINKQVKEIEIGMQNNPEGQLSSEIENLYVFWKEVTLLNSQEKELDILKKKIEVTKDLLDKIRNIAKRFREELEDFSGRVVEIINMDVHNYYDALHPNDEIKPYLETQIDGSKRKVLLKCDYKGFKSKDAASLLSESHRNSLGLSVMLAFMKYKRQNGSPVEFLILDDVTQSFDVGHRANLINFLESPDYPEISSNQIILLTHDRTLADFVHRPGENKENWLRYDIRSWNINALVIEPTEYDFLVLASKYLADGDEIAAAIYGRHALEQVYKFIVSTANLSIPFTSKPWNISLDTFQTAICKEVKRLWDLKVTVGTSTFNRGIIDPKRFRINKLNMSLRILHLTVHESDFLENPPSSGDVQAALKAVEELRNMFTCPNCRQHNPKPIYQYFHTFDKGGGANAVFCKTCKQQLPAD